MSIPSNRPADIGRASTGLAQGSLRFLINIKTPPSGKPLTQLLVSPEVNNSTLDRPNTLPLPSGDNNFKQIFYPLSTDTVLSPEYKAHTMVDEVEGKIRKEVQVVL